MATTLSRRAFLKQSMLFASAYLLANMPRLSWANTATEQRLLVIVLRGAMDGLGVVPPIGDPHYHDARDKLAFTDKGFLPLDNFFALNAALASFQALFTQKELLILHACATPYRDRSHFEAQNLLENGSTTPHGLNSGWLGRTVDSLGSTVHSLAVGPSIPLILQGNTIPESWSPATFAAPDQDFMQRIKTMYAADPLLAQNVNSVIDNSMASDSTNIEQAHRQQFGSMMQMAASLLLKPNGARIASIDLGGWDTHADQGLDNGRLAQALRNLSEGVASFKQSMESIWSLTTVLAITEFGRTVMVNGSNGSDHGTASAAFLLGGNVNGGRVIGEWPGLGKNNLYQERDLYPANDLRSLLKGVLQDALQIPLATIEQDIFPDSAQAKPLSGLFQV